MTLFEILRELRLSVGDGLLTREEARAVLVGQGGVKALLAAIASDGSPRALEAAAALSINSAAVGSFPVERPVPMTPMANSRAPLVAPIPALEAPPVAVNDEDAIPSAAEIEASIAGLSTRPYSPHEIVAAEAQRARAQAKAAAGK